MAISKAASLSNRPVRANTPQISQPFAAAPAVNTPTIQTEMSAHTEHQSSSLAPTITDSQSDHSNVAQLSMMTPGNPRSLVQDARPPLGASGTAQHTTDIAMNQDADPHKMDVVVSKPAEARKVFKKKKQAPANDDEEDESEELFQLLKDFAKKGPSKTIQDEASPSSSFLSLDNKIAHQPSHRKLPEESTPEEIDQDVFNKEMADILREQKFLSKPARRPGSARGKSIAITRRTTPSSTSLGSSSQPQFGGMGSNFVSSPLNPQYNLASSMPPPPQIGSNIARSTPNSFASSSQKPGVYTTVASGSSTPFQPQIGGSARRNPLEGPVSYNPMYPNRELTSPTSGFSQYQPGVFPPSGVSPGTSGFQRMGPNIDKPFVPMTFHSSYIPSNAPTTQGMAPQRIASLRQQEVEAKKPICQSTPRRPNREGKDEDSVRRSTSQPSNISGGNRTSNWPPVRSRLGGNVITATSPPQRTTEDVAMSSVSNLSATTVERSVPNVSSTPSPSAPPRIEVQSSAQGQASANPSTIASSHHAAGDITMNVVAPNDGAKESNINPVPLPAPPPPAAQSVDNSSSSTTPMMLSDIPDPDIDDMYGDEAVYSDDDDQTVMGDPIETTTQESTIGQISSGPQGGEASAASTANVVYTTRTNASVSTPKAQAVASSEVEVKQTTIPGVPGAASSPAADASSEVEASAPVQVTSATPEVNPLDFFASVASSPNVDATLAQFREDKAKRQDEEDRSNVILSQVEEHQQESQSMDVSAPESGQSSEQVASNAQAKVAQVGEESMEVGILESMERISLQETMSEEPSSHSMDVGQYTEVSESSVSPSFSPLSTQLPLPEMAPAIQTDDVDMAADETPADNATACDSPALEPPTSPLEDGEIVELKSVSTPPALQTLEAPRASSIASSHPPTVESASKVEVSPASKAPPPATTSKASTTGAPPKASAKPAVPPSSEDKTKNAAMPPPSSKTLPKFTKNPGTLPKEASKTSKDDLKVAPDVPKSPKPKSSENAKAKPKDNKTTMGPPPVPAKRTEAKPNSSENPKAKPKENKTTMGPPPVPTKRAEAKPKSSENSMAKPKDNKTTMGPPPVPTKRTETTKANTTKQSVSDKKDSQPRSSTAATSQRPKTKSSVEAENSPKVQGSPSESENTKPSNAKGKKEELEEGECPPDEATTEAAGSPGSSSANDGASKKESTAAAATSSPSPSPTFVPTTYSFPKKDKKDSVPGESDHADSDSMEIDVESYLMDTELDGGSNDNDVEMGECTEDSEQMKVDPVGVPLFSSVPLTSNNGPLFPGLSSSQPSSGHNSNNAFSGFSTAWNSSEPAFKPQPFSFLQAQQPSVAPIPSMVHNPSPNPVECVYNFQSPSPCLANNNVGVNGFCGPVLYDQGFQPGAPFEPSSNNWVPTSPKPLDKPSLESLLRESYEGKPLWKPFSVPIPRYVEPVSYQYRRPDDLETPSLDALLGDWKPEVTFSSPVRGVEEPILEATVEPLVTEDTSPVEELSEVHDAPVEPTREAVGASPEPPASDIDTATEATDFTPSEPTGPVRNPRGGRCHYPEGRGHPYSKYLRRSQFSVEEPEGTPPVDLETTQPLERRPSLKTTSNSGSKPNTKRRRMPGAWRGPLTPRTPGEEKFYRLIGNILRHLRQRVCTAFEELDKAHKASNRSSSKHRLRTRVSV